MQSEHIYGNVYAIRCKANGKVYIGRTTNFKKRCSLHFCLLEREASGQERPVHSADFISDYKQYGRSNFECLTIDRAPKPWLPAAEAFAIQHFDSCKHGYNIRTEEANLDERYYPSFRVFLTKWRFDKEQQL